MNILLAILIVTFSWNGFAAALVARSAGLIRTLPLTRSHNIEKSSLHPAIIHQQHVNLAAVRLAHMSGLAPIPKKQLLNDLLARISTLPRREQEKYLTDRRRRHSMRLHIQAHDIGYYLYVSIGTPPRSFKLLIDSGSADLWVAAEGCRANDGGSCGSRHKQLGPSSSSSFVKTNMTWSISYNTGAVSGDVVRDNVTIASCPLPGLQFGVAQNETADFIDNSVPFDGLLGTAKSTYLSQQHTMTVVEVLASKKLIQDAIVSYKISRLADGKDDGEVTFGGLDPSKYIASSLVTVNNISPFGFWQVNVGNVKINGKSLGLTNRSAIVDTGTSLFYAPQEDVAAIHKAIPGSQYVDGNWLIPCNCNTSLSLSFGGKYFSVDPRDLAFLPIDPNNPTGNCYSSISSGSPANPITFWLLGDAFLKNVYLSTKIAADGMDKVSIAKLA
ncbi:aspartic peptidase A1 [Mycena floridula]|nr:aspartic peptidase A1 [Mycena floridula]